MPPGGSLRGGGFWGLFGAGSHGGFLRLPGGFQGPLSWGVLVVVVGARVQ